jgi:hypothetical protein
LADGTELRERVEIHPGGIGNPLEEEALRAKFRACAAEVLSAGEAASVEAMVDGLASAPDVRLLCHALRGAAG